MEKAQYDKERYAQIRAERLALKRKQRDARKAWFKELRFQQDCEHCGARRMGVRWHYRDRAKDHADSERNLAEVMHMVRNGYKEETILAKLRSELIALCAKCAQELRADLQPNYDKTSRQAYENAYRARHKDTVKEQHRKRKLLRQDWLDEQMKQPCSVCQSWVGVEWHHTNPAFDHSEERINLMTVRRVVNNCAAMIHIQAAFAALYPICRTCYEQKLHSNSG